MQTNNMINKQERHESQGRVWHKPCFRKYFKEASEKKHDKYVFNLFVHE